MPTGSIIDKSPERASEDDRELRLVNELAGGQVYDASGVGHIAVNVVRKGPQETLLEHFCNIVVDHPMLTVHEEMENGISNRFRLAVLSLRRSKSNSKRYGSRIRSLRTHSLVLCPIRRQNATPI